MRRSLAHRQADAVVRFNPFSYLAERLAVARAVRVIDAENLIAALLHLVLGQRHQRRHCGHRCGLQPADLDLQTLNLGAVRFTQTMQRVD